MNYCPNCGAELLQGMNYCESCGENLDEFLESADEDAASSPDRGVGRRGSVDGAVDSRDSPERRSDRRESAESDDERRLRERVGESQQTVSDSFFNMTMALSGAYVLLMIMAISTAPSLGYLAVLCIVGSIVTMALDLSKIDSAVWDTSTARWVVGAVLLWIVVMPLYLYKRSQAV